MQNDEWLKDRIAYLKGLKARSEQQELLVLLAEKPARDASDEKKLKLLVRAEKAAERAAKARNAATRLIQADRKAERDAERKARNHRLILQGTLIDLAGLENRSRAEILGALLSAASTDDAQRWTSWRAKGEALLAEKGEQP